MLFIIKKNQNFFKLPLLQQWIADYFCLGLSLHRIFNQRQRIITKYGLKRSHTLLRPRSRWNHSFHRSLGLLSEQISKQMLPLSIFVSNLHGNRSLPNNRNHSSTTRHSRWTIFETVVSKSSKRRSQIYALFRTQNFRAIWIIRLKNVKLHKLKDVLRIMPMFFIKWRILHLHR